MRKAGAEYFDWVMSLSDHLQTFATFTFPRLLSYEWAFRKGKKLWRLTNQYACGRRFREHHDGLMSVLTVEAKHGRPHIHMIQEAHPSLTPEVYFKLWGKAYGGWSSSNAIKIEPIHSKEAVARYISKGITWEHPPFIFIPKKYQNSG